MALVLAVSVIVVEVNKLNEQKKRVSSEKTNISDVTGEDSETSIVQYYVRIK